MYKDVAALQICIQHGLLDEPTVNLHTQGKCLYLSGLENGLAGYGW